MAQPASHSDIGKPIAQLDTPALLVDLDALDHNIATMAAAAAKAGADWRPHIKASKAPGLAQRLVAGGAVGVTSAKVSEAEAMIEGGMDDILIANEVVGPIKIARLATLAQRARLCIAVDHIDNLREVAAAMQAAGASVDVLIDINVNMNRCGIPPEAAPTLAEQVQDLATSTGGVRLRGLMGYEGHVMGLEPEAKERESAAAADVLREARRLVEGAGFEVETTSGGGTGNYPIALAQGHLSELQAGGGVLMDRAYVGMGVKGHEPSLFVLTQIISVPDDKRAIGDAGWKTTGMHTGLPVVHGRDDLQVRGLNAEHTIYQLEPEAGVHPGDQITLVPAYSDSTILLHRQLHAVRNGAVEEVWPIAAAGALQ
jgi:D-serine deaminase-like pyridoxal phosphate-dependent protein